MYIYIYIYIYIYVKGSVWWHGTSDRWGARRRGCAETRCSAWRRTRPRSAGRAVCATAAPALCTPANANYQASFKGVTGEGESKSYGARPVHQSEFSIRSAQACCRGTCDSSTRTSRA